MRPFVLTMTASAGLVIFLTTSPANSITISAPAAAPPPRRWWDVRGQLY